MNVSRFVVELLAFADVAHERFDAHRAGGGGGIRARRQLDPDSGMVGAPQSQQVVGHRAVGREPFEHRATRLRVDEAIDLERAHVAVGRVARDSRR